jgi:accessory gene regulator protein AgrB
VITKPHERGGHSLYWATEPEKKKKKKKMMMMIIIIIIRWAAKSSISQHIVDVAYYLHGCEY